MFYLELTPFTLQLPNINKLGIALIGGPTLDEEGNAQQLILQHLVDEDDVIREAKNRTVPYELAALLLKFMKGEESEQEITFVNSYIKTFNEDLNLKAKEIVEEEEENTEE